MNLKLVLKIVGLVMLVEAGAMVLPLVVSLLYREDPMPFLLTIVLLLCIGMILTKRKTKQQFYNREGYFSVGLIWMVTGFMGALPFHFSGTFPSFVDCLFETYSGFTTTGATILTDIESLPKGILFWRAFTHWLGGMGVLVLLTALLPSMGVRSHYLTQAESPGPVFSKLVPKQSQTSKILYSIYFGLTALQIVILKLLGMPLYDSFIHAFSSAGTGGFSNRNASVGAYGDPVIEMVIAVFVTLFSVNFAVYYLILCRRFKEVLESDELKFFLLVVAGSTLAITINLRGTYGSFLECFRYAFFQVTSIISTTGFATADYCLWPEFSQMLLMLLLICGACAGSTGGGLKCSRVLLALRMIRRDIRKVIHPRMVEVVRLDGRVAEEETLNSVGTYISCYLLLVFGGALIISLDNYTFGETLTAVMTCLNNVGPGIGRVGPSGNFYGFSPVSKLVMSWLMVVGRLEIFPILVLFSKRAWRKG